MTASRNRNLDFAEETIIPGGKIMTPEEREFALKELDGSREGLLGSLRGLSREQLAFAPRPTVGRWRSV